MDCDLITQQAGRERCPFGSLLEAVSCAKAATHLQKAVVELAIIRGGQAEPGRRLPGVPVPAQPVRISLSWRSITAPSVLLAALADDRRLSSRRLLALQRPCIASIGLKAAAYLHAASRYDATCF